MTKHSMAAALLLVSLVLVSLGSAHSQQMRQGPAKGQNLPAGVIVESRGIALGDSLPKVQKKLEELKKDGAKGWRLVICRPPRAQGRITCATPLIVDMIA